MGAKWFSKPRIRDSEASSLSGTFNQDAGKSSKSAINGGSVDPDLQNRKNPGQAAHGAPNHPVVMDDHFSIETHCDLGIPILGTLLYYNILQLRKVWLGNAILSSTFFEEIQIF